MLDPSFLESVNVSIIPSADNTYDLGENTTPLRWRNGFFAGTLTVNSLVKVTKSSGFAFYDLERSDIPQYWSIRIYDGGDLAFYNATDNYDVLKVQKAGNVKVVNNLVVGGNNILDSDGNTRITLGSTVSISGNAYVSGSITAETSGDTFLYLSNTSGKKYGIYAGTGGLGFKNITDGQQEMVLWAGGDLWIFGDLQIGGNDIKDSGGTTRITLGNQTNINGVLINVDQGGSIELGDSLSSGVVPYIDFHYGTGASEDYNVRLQNYADKAFWIKFGDGTVALDLTNTLAKIGTNLEVSGYVRAGAGESRFWLSTYSDPHFGVAYAIKIGDGGIAVNGDSLFNNNVKIGEDLTIREIWSLPKMILAEDDISLTAFVSLNGGTTYIAPLFDDTIVYVNGSFVGKVDRGSRLSVTLSAGDIVSANKPIMVHSSSERHVPITWADTKFVIPFYRNDPQTIYIYAPFGDANVDVYVGTSTTPTTTVSVTKGTATSVDVNVTPPNTVILESDSPILVAVASNNQTYDFRFIHPPARDLIGIPSNGFYVSALEDGTTITWYQGDNSGTYTLNRGEIVSNSTLGITTGGAYNATPVRVIANKPIMISSFADGDGTDATCGLPLNKLGTYYVLAVSAQWLSIAVPFDNTRIRIYQGGTLKYETTVSNTYSNNTPALLYLTPADIDASWTSIPYGVVIESDKPIMIIFDCAETWTDDETVLLGINHMRWRIYQNQALVGNTDLVVFTNNILDSDGNTRITMSSTNTKITTDYGYVQIGPQNTGYCHFLTDRSQFYFNKQIVVNGSLIRYTNTSAFVISSAQGGEDYGSQIVLYSNGASSDKGCLRFKISYDSNIPNDPVIWFQVRDVQAGATNTLAKLDRNGNLWILGDLQINGNDIIGSDGKVRISLDETSTTPIAGFKAYAINLRRTAGAQLFSEDGTLRLSGTSSGTQVTIDGSGNMIIGGDLRINGNDIKDSGGNTRITLGSTNYITGDLNVSGGLVTNGNVYMLGNIKVGINKSVPTYTLHVVGDSIYLEGNSIKVYNASSHCNLVATGKGTSAYSLLSLEDNSSSLKWQMHYRLSVPKTRALTWYWYDGSTWYYRMYLTTAGDLYAYSYNTISSLKLKKDVRDFNGKVLDKLAKVRVRRFKWIDSDREDLGLIADELANIFPELVSYDYVPSDPTKVDAFDDSGFVKAPSGYNLNKLVIYLLKALQELYSEVIELRRRVAR